MIKLLLSFRIIEALAMKIFPTTTNLYIPSLSVMVSGPRFQIVIKPTAYGSPPKYTSAPTTDNFETWSITLPKRMVSEYFFISS